MEIKFVGLDEPPEATAVVIAPEKSVLVGSGLSLDRSSGWALTASAQAAGFAGTARTSIELLAAPRLPVKRLLLIGCGQARTKQAKDWVQLGGYTMAEILKRPSQSVSIFAEVANAEQSDAATVAADLAFGACLRAYEFNKYKTARAIGLDNGVHGTPRANPPQRLFIHCAEPTEAAASFVHRQAVAKGVYFARDLVNEPPNVLTPNEFAVRVRTLEDIGLEIDILDQSALADLQMGALLAIAQGSSNPARLCVMKWFGAKDRRQRPIALVGKGVTFDTGGLSVKTATGMEGMKGDMAGAACVAGAMVALAERRARANVIGIIGCVENMISGNACRPGDVVRSMSGQTVEVINTDAEGRMVLADLLWFAQKQYKPKLMVDFATLTGAVMVALGKDCAGLFSNSDRLTSHLLAASKATGEKLWRLPLDPTYDKLISSTIADMKNVGGKYAPASTAAQFIQRFVKRVSWAHIDMAGPAMDSPDSDISTSWGSGWGVQLIDRFVALNYEKKPNLGSLVEDRALPAAEINGFHIGKPMLQ